MTTLLVHYPYCNTCEKVVTSFLEEPPGTFTTTCHGRTWVTDFPPRTVRGGTHQSNNVTRPKDGPYSILKQGG